MVDLEKLDATHAKLTCGLITEVAERFPDEVADLVNAYLPLAREVRALRALAERSSPTCGDGACRYRPAEVTFDGKTVTVMNSRDAHTLSDVVAELAALRALAEVVKAQCDWAHPGWVPEIREALALVEKAKAP